MRINTNKFCSLSTSPSWQAWLFHFNAAIYKQFMGKLRESRGCTHSRDIMIELLADIDKIEGGTTKLGDFLKQQYPHMLIGVEADTKPSQKVVDTNIFPNFNPSIKTYPRRIIFNGGNLKKKVHEFLLDKLKSDSVIINEQAFVEYVDRSDHAIVDQIPAKNWLISQWRLKSNSE